MGTTRKNKTANHSHKRLTPVQDKSAAKSQNVSEAACTALINAESYRRLYAGILKCRMMEERACAILGRQKAAASYKQAIGQEAAAVGAIAVLRPEDIVAPSDRGFVTQTAQGAPMKAVFEQMLGESLRRPGSSAHARVAASTHRFTPATTVEVQAAVAAGMGLRGRIDNKENVVLALSAEEWADSNQLHATLEFISRNRLPVVFVVHSVESQSVGEKRGAAEKLTILAHSCGATHITVDGTDAVAVYRVASESIGRARKGVGPTIIDCKFMPTEKRRSSPDPLVHMENYMRKRSAWSDEWKKQLVKQFTREIDIAVSFAQRGNAKGGKSKRPAK